jgi:heme oxygenase
MVCDFPSAPICDSVMALDSMIAVLNPQSIKERYKKYQRKDTYYTETEDFLDSMGYWAKEISDLVAKYKDVTKDLSDVNDPRAEQLITRTTEDCKNAICSIFE